MKIMKKDRGITLIALVVTIIVLMILAGVVVSLLSGDRSVMQGAQEASGKYSVGASEEKSIVDKLNNTIKLQQLTEGTADYIAEDISQNNNASKYYGKYVDYEPTEEVTDIGWRIFYIGPTPGETENNIYLIADHYVPREDLPAAYGTDILLNEGDNSKGLRTAYFANWNSLTGTVMEVYSDGTDNIGNDNLARDWLSKYWEMLDGAKSANDNIKAVAYMMDTRIWNKFGKNGVSKYVIGGPTIELFVESWNKVNEKMLEITNVDTSGYYINNTHIVEELNDTTNLWVPSVQNSQNEAFGMFVSSPSTYDSSNLVGVYSGNAISAAGYHNTSLGFRPIVCLNTDVQLSTTDDGTTYKIVK